jgi:hypothetical protein
MAFHWLHFTRDVNSQSLEGVWLPFGTLRARRLVFGAEMAYANTKAIRGAVNRRSYLEMAFEKCLACFQLFVVAKAGRRAYQSLQMDG